ncbi:hypothetical protein [Aliiroseovarius lamellibrachiae]|uniref:hypothetical protein n=1 Tax=Aliiroseovarius lamellibrachiae TaxID=1924933 RepID=UPI001BE038E8|nr:hypothetical protein [Aliiroseovarius lamellibrachiae]MBT2129852.1 hypothetical protein [Aliiroseovarius lamellibrachiae]
MPPDSPPKIIVHFGVHKTGTTTAEATLEANRDLLAPVAQIVTRKTWPDVTKAAKIHSTDPSTLTRFGEVFAARLADVVLGADQALLISNVDLSGQLPGHPEVTNYDGLPARLNEIQGQLLSRFGAQAQLRFVMTTRGPAAWLRSLWAQNLKVHREVRSQEEFAEQFADLAQFSPLIKAISCAISPGTLTVEPLENTSLLPMGPATAALRPLGSVLPPLPLVPHRPMKQSLPEEALELLLGMNRSGVSDKALKEVKSDAIYLMQNL